MAAFIPGYPPSPARFLARFLPPLAEGVAADYLERYSQPGNLILDPFGQAPAVAVEALHLRRRVLVVSFNPISRLAVSLGVRPPTADELRRALTLLGDTRRENERLESYVRGLYQTTCAACDTEVMADEFEWEAGELITKTYLCPHCGGPPQTVPASDADKARAARFTRQRLDYHFLLERVAPLNDPDRPYAQEVIEVYPARALAALAACLSKFETLEAGSETRRLVSALIVSACDEACPLGPDRPRQLIAPKRYTEVNVWLALERAVSQLAGERGANIPAPEVMPLPTLLAPGRTAGIHAFTGPARDLAPQLPPAVCALMLTAFPRPNQAYWTLSAVWSAWLWGRESAATLRAVLRRRRYDWEWHADGLSRTLTGLRPALAANPAGNLIGLLPEAEPGFWAGVMIALNRAGFQVTGAALRADTSEAQLIGHTAVQAAGQPEAADLASTIQTTALEAAQAALRARAEPTRWPHVHFNAWRGLAERGLLAHAPEEPLGTVNRWLEPIFRKATNFQRFDAQAGDDLTTGLWAVPDDGIPAPSLTDQVELETWRILANAGAAPLHTVEVMRALCQTFTGPTTPSQQVVSACLHSYAVETQPEQWRLRPEDAPGKRAGEAEELRTQLRALAARHGYAVAVEGEWIEWREADQTVYRFGVTASAALSALVRSIEKRARRNFFVLPGSRVALAAFKLRRNPGLHIAFIEQNCLLVKFRHLRRMLTDAQLTRATLEPAFAADPPEEAQQLSLMADSRFA